MLWEVHIYIYIYMITTIIYVDIAFFYRKANILHRWSNILRVSLLQISVIQMETCIASHGLSAVAILKLCCVSVQDSRGWSVYEHTAVRVFLLTDNLHLLDCSVTWSPLTRTDADWTCWLAANARVWKHKHRFSVLMLQHTDCNGRHPQVLHCRRQQAWHRSQHAWRQGSSAVIHSHPSSNWIRASTHRGLIHLAEGSARSYGGWLWRHATAVSVADASQIYFPTPSWSSRFAAHTMPPASTNCPSAMVCQTTYGR